MMADIDTSTYPKPKNTNPLDTMSGFATLQNVLNQNKLFQQQYNTNLAVSEGMKAAIDPNTGQYDPEKLRAWMANNPNAGYGLGSIIQQSQEAQQRNLNINQSQIDLARKNIDTLGSYIIPLESKRDQFGKPSATVSDIYIAAAKAITAGHADPKVIGQYLSDLPGDDSQVPAWIHQKHLQFLDTQARFNAMHPTPTMQQLPGGGMAPFVMPQEGQVQQVGPTIPGAPSPTQTYTDPQNVPRYFGNVATNPYAPNAGAQGGAPGQSGGGGPQVSPGGQPNGNIAGIPAGMSPAASAASTESGGDSAKQLAALRSEVGGSANRVFQLQQASKALEGALTGKGSQTIQDWRSLLVTSGMASQSQAESVKNFDEAKKYMIGAMLNRGTGLGINTNEKLAALSGASASTDISKLAAKDILRTNIGLEKAQQAQYAAFEKSGLPPEQFASWAANWNKDRDLRAYPLVEKPMADRAKFLESLKPAERTKVLGTLREAVNLGILPISDFAK